MIEFKITLTRVAARALTDWVNEQNAATGFSPEVDIPDRIKLDIDPLPCEDKYRVATIQGVDLTTHAGNGDLAIFEEADPFGPNTDDIHLINRINFVGYSKRDVK